MMRLTLCLFLALLTTACGWQLRGSSSIPQALERIYLTSSDEHSALTTDVRQVLLTNKVVITESSSDAPLSLRVLEENIDRRTAAVGADALTSAFELYMTVGYEVRDKQGELLAQPATASITRIYNYNPNDAASSAREETLLVREMRQDLAGQLIRRVNALYSDSLKQTPTSKSKPDAKTAP